MNNNPAFQDALARARQIAEKLSASSTNNSLKRPNSDEDSVVKRPAVNQPIDTLNPASRAQMVAQQINSQLGVKTMNENVPLSNKLMIQEDYHIPEKFVGLIIGKGGEQITRLQAESGCKVQICQTRQEPIAIGTNSADRIANLSGTRDAVDRVRKMMDEIIARARAPEINASQGTNPYSAGGSTVKTIEVLLPSAKCGLVIGKGGENIRRVSEEFGIKMYVGQETTNIEGIEHKPLKITGEPDRIERTKQHVLDLLARSGPIGSTNRYGSHQTSNPSHNEYGSKSEAGPSIGPCNEATYLVPYDKAGLIIGKGGETVKEINRKSGAYVELDKSNPASLSNFSERLFKIRGTPEQIATAQQMMYERVVNGPGAPPNILTPIQFQQQFNLPLLGSKPIESSSNVQDSSGTDLYSQWFSAYNQWATMSSYENSGNGSSSSTADAASQQVDPAWLAYYQSMGYYNMMQPGAAAPAPAPAAPAATTTTATKSTDNTASASATGQTDYSQQWIEYYRATGQNDLADEIIRQTKERTANSSTNNDVTKQWNSSSNGVGSTNLSSAPSS